MNKKNFILCIVYTVILLLGLVFSVFGFLSEIEKFRTGMITYKLFLSVLLMLFFSVFLIKWLKNCFHFYKKNENK